MDVTMATKTPYQHSQKWHIQRKWHIQNKLSPSKIYYCHKVKHIPFDKTA